MHGTRANCGTSYIGVRHSCPLNDQKGKKIELSLLNMVLFMLCIVF